MGCSHNFQYARGSFYCSKCGKRSRGRTRGTKHRTGIIVAIIAVILVAGALYWIGPDRTTDIVQDEVSKHVTLNDNQITVNLPDVETISDDLSSQIASVTENPPVRTSSGFDGRVVEDYIYQFTNDERQRMGIPTLARVSAIDMVARNHSIDMSERNYFEHDTPEGLDPTARGELAGYSCVKDYGTHYTEGLAENISQGHTYSSYVTAGVTSSYDWHESEMAVASEIFSGWMNSPGHRENILDNTYDRIGVGVEINSNEVVYATQNFC